ncbi:hypothetical protein VN12_14050 [Pirellula sp. SH-Sr6A]|uniref:hypothetical protein n=1 Tax=Pirellula sp. SH-Sr6A TaxID=1632865 RepID=UPI00078B8959|nr:hypothetical protein [Pirellula sp. SH-Sr6A]AMV33245.1 hypothetical protein VN12_14050 [Pirellula sp. SH-Sr6A]
MRRFTSGGLSLTILLVAWLTSVQSLVPSGFTQEVRTTNEGFHELVAPNMRLITDLEIDDELKRWPAYLEQATEQWKRIFAPPPAKLQGSGPVVYLVGDRARWERSGLLAQVPRLEDGFQLGDQLYVVEQSSTYYRRLLFLHEATHWVMYRWQGGAGSPWLMEGMADLLGTHRFQQERLELGYFPTKPEDVPSWGRLRLIRETLEQKTAPKLSAIVSFPDMRQQRMERYSWSWAACTFLMGHPELSKDFQTIYRGNLDYGMTSSKRFFQAMEDQWSGLSLRWRCFVDDLDFGMDIARSSLLLQGISLDEPNAKPTATEIASDRGWQAVLGPVPPGTNVQIKASGRIVVRRPDSAPVWESEAAGVTVEYHRGFPLGCLLGVWAEVDTEQPSEPWTPIRIGKGTSLESPARPAILLLRINEPSSGLADNQGSLQISLGP